MEQEDLLRSATLDFAAVYTEAFLHAESSASRCGGLSDVDVADGMRWRIGYQERLLRGRSGRVSQALVLSLADEELRKDVNSLLW